MEQRTREIIMEEVRDQLLAALPEVIAGMREIARHGEREENRLSARLHLVELAMRYRVCVCGSQHCSDPVIQELNRRSDNAKN